MISVEAALRRIVADLTFARHAFALVGGFAVSARTEPRFTRDVDLAVAVPDDHAAEAVLRDSQPGATASSPRSGTSRPVAWPAPASRLPSLLVRS
jgi:hypothetical protein